MGKTSKALGKSGYSLDIQVPTDETIDTVGSLSPEKVTDKKKIPNNSEVSKKSQQLRTGKRPENSGQWDERLEKVISFTNKTAESFRVLRSKILLPQDGRPAPKTIMVTSALPREGKTFVSANLGIALAQGMDQHALVVDCDLRVPSLAKLFGGSPERGLVDYLQKSAELSDLLQKTSMEKLSILAGGIPPANPAELLGSTRMKNLVDELASRYPDRYVIFDTPPLEIASESKVLSRAVDGVVLVVRQGVASKDLIEKFVTDIGKDKILGVIFNGQETNFVTTMLVDKSHYYYGNYYKKKGK